MVVQKRKQMSSYGIYICVSKHVCNANLQVCQPLSSRIYKNRQIKNTNLLQERGQKCQYKKIYLPSFYTKIPCSSGVSTVRNPVIGEIFPAPDIADIACQLQHLSTEPDGGGKSNSNNKKRKKQEGGGPLLGCPRKLVNG